MTGRSICLLRRFRFLMDWAKASNVGLKSTDDVAVIFLDEAHSFKEVGRFGGI